MRGWLILPVLCCTTPLWASEPFTITDTFVVAGTGEAVIGQFLPQLQGKGQGPAVEAQLNTFLANLSTKLQSDVNKQLDGLQIKRFLGHMGDAMVAGGKQMAIDYATDASIFSLSVGGGGVINSPTQQILSNPATLADDFNNTLPEVGLGAAASVLLGINLRHFHLPKFRYFDFGRLQVFINFMTVSRQIATAAFDDPLSLRYMTLGAHAQYRLVRQHSVLRGGLLRWGGVSVATGFDFSSLSALAAGSLPSGVASGNFVQGGTTLRADVTWGGNANLGLDFGAASIPLEVYTNVQLLYFLSLYVGAALDFNFGASSFSADVQSARSIKVTLRDPNTQQSTEIANPNAALNLNAQSAPASVGGRALAGAQINLGVVALFVQGNIDTARNLGANGGLRLFW